MLSHLHKPQGLPDSDILRLRDFPLEIIVLPPEPGPVRKCEAAGGLRDVPAAACTANRRKKVDPVGGVVQMLVSVHNKGMKVQLAADRRPSTLVRVPRADGDLLVWSMRTALVTEPHLIN